MLNTDSGLILKYLIPNSVPKLSKKKHKNKQKVQII